jgi:hypothetical protein
MIQNLDWNLGPILLLIAKIKSKINFDNVLGVDMIYPTPVPLYLTRDQWKENIAWFLLEESSQNIAVRTSPEQGRVLRDLTIVGRWNSRLGARLPYTLVYINYWYQ